MAPSVGSRVVYISSGNGTLSPQASCCQSKLGAHEQLGVRLLSRSPDKGSRTVSRIITGLVEPQT